MLERAQFLDDIIGNPVIAAVRTREALELALRSPVKAVFLLSGSVNDIVELCRDVLLAEKHCFIHVDLLEGLRPDLQGLSFINSQASPTGILTTRPACVKWAQSLGLLTVQRIFLLDTTALLEGARHIDACKPDLVEVLPGVSEKAIRLAAQHFKRPLIAGGLIDTKEEVCAALAAGALAISASEPALWSL
jgi:glycerol uptake operon antiterminator